ncbi:MAG: ABC transporter permease, partial [Clostridium sp.]
MLIENMKMAFSALKANKMRSFLTMLGIIIGIGSVISIVSIGDTMRSMFSSLYKDIGITQSYVSIGYWLDDSRESDNFTMEDLERIKEVFGDKVTYIDSGATSTGDAIAGRSKLKFNLTGVDYNYQTVQPVDILYGRYLNQGDIKGRKQNAV